MFKTESSIKKNLDMVEFIFFQIFSQMKTYGHFKKTFPDFPTFYTNEKVLTFPDHFIYPDFPWLSSPVWTLKFDIPG